MNRRSTAAFSLNFNPRSPHGERRNKRRTQQNDIIISIHAPRTGSDLIYALYNRRYTYFNPRSPHGERPAGDIVEWGGADISIHAPRTGSDVDSNGEFKQRCDFNPRSPHGERRLFAKLLINGGENFNPRSPHGERLSAAFGAQLASTFQSTLPARGATSQYPVE